MPEETAVDLRGESQPWRAAIYTRVSRDMRDGRSVAEQEAECRAWVDHEGWTLAGKGVWCDNDRSASQYATKVRGEWQDLLEAIEAGQIDILVVWEPARATRDRGVWAFLAGICETNDVKIGASGRVYDLTDPEDAFQLDLFFALAARESRVTKKRIERTQRSSVAGGRPHGRLLYGYRREYRLVNGAHIMTRQLIDDTVRTAFAPVCSTASKKPFIPISTYIRSEIIRTAAKRAIADESLVSLARELNALGIPAPQHAAPGWQGTVLKKMLINPGYAGKRTLRGEVIGDAAWPALLDPVTHYTLTAKLSDPSRLNHRDGAVKHYLSGLMTCGVCGNMLGIQPDDVNPMYTCSQPPVNRGGKWYHVGRTEARMHALVRGLVALRLSRPDAEEAFVRHDVDVDVLKGLLDEAAELNASHRETISLGSTGKLSPLAVAGIEAGLIPKIKKVEAKIRALRTTPLAASLVRPTPEEVAATWDGLTVHQQREMTRALFVSIVVHPLGRGVWQRGTLLTGIDLTWRRPPGGISTESMIEPMLPTVGDSATEAERVVPGSGRICVAGTRISLGKERAGESVVARYDDQRLIVYSADGAYLASAERPSA